jgi:hypothetical protein
MGRKWTEKRMDQVELMSHMPSPVARAAFKTGNAAGVHGEGKNLSKINRHQTRNEERLANRGDYEDNDD